MKLKLYLFFFLLLEDLRVWKGEEQNPNVRLAFELQTLKQLFLLQFLICIAVHCCQYKKLYLKTAVALQQAIGLISAAFSCLVYVPPREERRNADSFPGQWLASFYI